ncbi:MAG TPA: HAMP domain-containing sensor histidine kinase [Actinomycetota bacterium]|nr:HAMP domain-containing sensor histidine kinase [Actinomycetota bacterium]
MGDLRGSTRVRILGWVLIPVLVVLVISWIAAWSLLMQGVDDRIDTELRGEVSELRLLAERGIDEKTGLPFTDVRSLLDQHIQRSIPDPNETMFVMVDGEVETRTSDDPPVRLDLDPVLLDQVRDVQDVTLGDLETTSGDVRWIAVPVEAGGQRGIFIVGIFADLEGADVATIMGRFAAIGLGSLVLAAGLAWFVAGRLLSPLRHMRDTAHEISETDLTRRIPVGDTGGDEVADLARTFNEMLDRLSEAFAAQRAFIDDAGHELRTPLTIVQGHLELLEDDPVQRAATLELVLDELSRMNRIVRDLQALTKANQPGFVHPEPVELGGLLDELLVKAGALGDQHWELAHRDRGIVVVDRQRVTQAMLQLAANAARHSPHDGSIHIGGRIVGDTVELFVADSGPGIPPQDRDAVTQRFSRGSTVDPGAEGAGLGLALVTAIAQAHHGHLDIGDSELGGAEMCMVLPAHAVNHTFAGTRS